MSDFSKYAGTEAIKRLVENTVSYVNTKTQDFTGATSTEDGKAGSIPAPKAGDEEKYLCADGTWKKVASGAGAIVSPTEPEGEDVNTFWLEEY